MQTADIATKDESLKVIFGPLKKAEKSCEDAYHHLKYLYSDMTDIRKYYIRLGFHLDEFERFSYYSDFGYSSLADFCLVNLGLDKGSVSRCLGVFRSFNASDDEIYRGCVKTTGCAMELSEQWKDYSYTQLCEMLSLSEQERKKINPQMSVKEIREFKRLLKEDKKKNRSFLVASTQQESKELSSPVTSTQQKTEELSFPVASTQPRLFDYACLNRFKGAVLQKYIKSLPSDGVKHIYLYSADGKEVYKLLECDVLCFDDSHIVLRMSSS